MLDIVPTTELSDELLPTLRQPGRLPLPTADEQGQAVKLERKIVPGSKGAPEAAILICTPVEVSAPRP